MTIELSIVMPCLNEAETLEACINKALYFLKTSGISGEVVIADNGSTDGSQAIARRCGAVVTDVPIRGYGAAIFYGVEAARGKYCIMGDSDDSYDFSRLELFVEELRSGADLVMGNRFRGGIAPGAMPWKNRYLGNPVLTSIGRILFKCPSRDFHCGLRAFSKDAFVRMDLRTTGMEFASEMVIKATLMKMKIVEVPTTLSPDGRSRPPHLRPYRDGWRHLRFMLLFSPNWLFLYPGLLLMTVGFVMSAVIFVSPLHIGRVRLSIDTLVYCAMAIEVGFQAVLFMLLSRALAVQEGLFPRPVRPSFVDRTLRLEYGVLVGLALALSGGFLGLYAVKVWMGTHFGTLDFESVTRIVIVSSMLFSLGFEIALSSFLLGMVRLSVRTFTLENTVAKPLLARDEAEACVS